VKYAQHKYSVSTMNSPPKPSLGFCLTGWLQPGERYHQMSHSYSGLVRTRAPNILEMYTMAEIEEWIYSHRDFIHFNLSTEQFEELNSMVELKAVTSSTPPKDAANLELTRNSAEYRGSDILRPPTPPPREN